MERQELNRMFDQLAPTAEQEQEGLHRLLQTERTVAPMKKFKKLTALGVAAALLIATWAAAVVTGVDQRLARYFGAEPEQAERLAAAAATEAPVSHAYDSGWTARISQVLSDRYMVAALIDITAPEGIKLPVPESAETAERKLSVMVDYRVEDRDGNLLGALKDAPIPVPQISFCEDDGEPVYDFTRWKGEHRGHGGAGRCVYLESSDPEHGRISVLWEFAMGTINHPDFQSFAGDALLGAKVSIIPKGVTFNGTLDTNKDISVAVEEFYFEDEDALWYYDLWSYELTLPETDPGSVHRIEAPLRIGKYEMELEAVYLSPLELSYEFTMFGPLPLEGLPQLYEEETRDYAIHMADGSSVSVKPEFFDSFTAVTFEEPDDGGIHQITLYPVELIDPAQVVSFSLFGQTFDLK